MNKQAYLNELKAHLKASDVSDIDEIIAEYDEHFSRKMADGYTEEEIAAKLGKPKEIALQFAQAAEGGERQRTNKLVVGTGLFFADLFVIPLMVIMYAWVAVVGAASIASAALGVALIARPLLPENIVIIPPMPYAGGAVWGVMLLAFGVLAAVAALYCCRLTVQLGKSYRRWHKNVYSGGKYPPYSMFPLLEDHLRRKLRTVALAALIVLGATFIIGYIILAVCAGALGFWHVWNWFV